jgi:glyoxylate carboligase
VPIYIIASSRIKVHADTPEQLVRYMHGVSRTQAADDVAYMMDVADRTILQSGGKIRSDTAAHFVDDLVEAGMIGIDFL